MKAARRSFDLQRRRASAWLAGPCIGSVVAWASLLKPKPVLANPEAAASMDALTLRPWPKTAATPALTLPSAEGPPWSLAAQAGKPVLLNFWASWCAPCRAEMPSLELLATRHEAQGLQVMAVNFRETDSAVRRFVDETGLTLPVLRDRDGGAAKAFGVRTFPSSVAINRQGRVVSVLIGECDWASPAARQWLSAIL